MGQRRVINEMGNMSSYVTCLATVLEESKGWKESWLLFDDCIYLFCIYSVLYT